MTMIATYERDRRLNVRAEPRESAPVVRTMASGESAECAEVRDGWAALADGYVDARLVVVSIGEALSKVADNIREAAGEVAKALEPASEVLQAMEDAGTHRESELRAMTNPELAMLADQYGLALRKKANKDELVAAIMEHEQG